MKNSARELQRLGTGLNFITVTKLHKLRFSLSLCLLCSFLLSPLLFGCLRTLPPRSLCSRGGGGRDAGGTGSLGLPPSPGLPRLGSPGLRHWHAVPGRTASLLEEMPAQSLAAPHTALRCAGSSTADNLGCPR